MAENLQESLHFMISVKPEDAISNSPYGLCENESNTERTNVWSYDTSYRNSCADIRPKFCKRYQRQLVIQETSSKPFQTSYTAQEQYTAEILENL